MQPRPGAELKPQHIETLRNIPEKLGNKGNDPATVEELVRLGYVEQKLGGPMLTAKGRSAIRAS